MNIKTLLLKKQRAYLTDLEMLMLIELANSGTMQRCEIADLILMPSKSLVYSIKSLMKRHLIDSTRDRTVTKYRITLEGKDTLTKILTK